MNDWTIDWFAPYLIRKKAWELVYLSGFTGVGLAGFSKSDREDIEQELYLHLVRRADRFDPAKGEWPVFVKTIIERHVADIVRRRRAQKRDPRRLCSLNVIVGEDGGKVLELGDTISQEEYDARRCRAPRDRLELAQLRMDVADVIATLPPQLRELAEALKHESKSEFARRMGVSRKTLKKPLRQLRRRFERAGLRDYL